MALVGGVLGVGEAEADGQLHHQREVQRPAERRRPRARGGGDTYTVGTGGWGGTDWYVAVWV